MIQTGQDKLNGSFFLDNNGLWAMRTSSQIRASDGTTLIGSNGDRLKVETTFENSFIDPFSRLITSQGVLLGSYDHRLGKHPDYFDEQITGSATSVHNLNTVAIDMSTTTASGDKVIRQSYRNFQYRRGNAQSIYISMNFNGGIANNRKRAGYFDEENGVYFEMNGTDFRVAVRSKTSGSVVDTAVSQSSFNIDKMDGTGTSGITLDTTKQNLYWIEFSWLGTNVVEFGCVIDKKKIVMHRFNFANIQSTAYSKTALLPFRFEIENTGATASSQTMSPSCFAVFSSGSLEDERISRTVSTGVTPINLTTTETVVAGIRINPNVKNLSVKPESYKILPISGATYMYYRILLRPTLTGATWSAGTTIDTLTNNPTFSGGILIDEGHVSLTNKATEASRLSISGDLFLGNAIDLTTDSLVITMRTDSLTGSVYFSGLYSEWR